MNGQTSGGTGVQINPRDVYDYLLERGVSPIHAKGMLANIQHESGFNPGSLGDKDQSTGVYTSGGLFQHHANRFQNLQEYDPNWAVNWQSQIDYALSEDSTQTYLNTNFKSPEEASTWFTINWERPANAQESARRRLSHLKKFDY